MNAEDFIKKETEKMASSLGAAEYQAKCAGADAVHEYKHSAVIKGGVQKLIEKHAKKAAKASKK